MAPQLGVLAALLPPADIAAHMTRELGTNALIELIKKTKDTESATRLAKFAKCASRYLELPAEEADLTAPPFSGTVDLPRDKGGLRRGANLALLGCIALPPLRNDGEWP